MEILEQHPAKAWLRVRHDDGREEWLAMIDVFTGWPEKIREFERGDLLVEGWFRCGIAANPHE
jgi:hypothetical protein